MSKRESRAQESTLMNIFGFVLADANGNRFSHSVATDLDLDVATPKVLADRPAGTTLVSSRDITSFPMWNNCIYKGNRAGHSHGFCTANACY